MRTTLAFFYQHKNVAEIENVLNKEFVNVCKWFIDSKLSIHFGKDKTKCILFSKEKNLEYLGFYLDANISRESMAMKSFKKINAKLQFLRQNEFVNPKLRGMLGNS